MYWKPIGNALRSQLNWSQYRMLIQIPDWEMRTGIGSGARKMFKYGKLYSGVEPEFFEDDVFRIIQPLNENYSFDAENEAGGQKGGQNEDSETTQKTAQKTTQKTTQKILDAISNNPNVTRLELSEICGITADGVKWQLKSLAKSGRISRIGGDRGGHWEVRDE